MNESSRWSVKIGRFGGVILRIHFVLFLFVLLTLYLSRLAEGRMGEAELAHYGQWSLVILLASVCLHELGHFAAAMAKGIRPTTIVLGPLGGMTPVQLPDHPRRELLILLAGPAVNLLICLVCAVWIFFLPGGFSWELLHPLRPAELAQPVRLVFWVNWVLVLANLLPVPPLDGNRIYRNLAMIALPIDASQAAHWISTLAKGMGATLLLCAWLFRDLNPAAIPPTWFALALLGIFLFFSAKQTEPAEAGDPVPRNDELDLDEAEPYPPPQVTLLDGPAAEHWADTVRDQSRRGPVPGIDLHRQADPASDVSPPLFSEPAALPGPHREDLPLDEDFSDEQFERIVEQTIDEILQRLHRDGMASLSDRDRRLLQWAGQRYRSRREAGQKPGSSK